QPETPFYFAVMKRVNKEGPVLVRELPAVAALDPRQATEISQQQLVIDTTSGGDFAAGHVAGMVNVPSGALVQWAGFFVDYTQPLYLLTSSEKLAENLRGLRSIGIDNVAGYFDADEVRGLRLRKETYGSDTPAELREAIECDRVHLVDVRSATEFAEEHIDGAEHRFLGTLLRSLHTLERDRPLVVQCRSGGRSAIAASVLERAGFDVINMQGGIEAWKKAGLSVVQGRAPAAV